MFQAQSLVPKKIRAFALLLVFVGVGAGLAGYFRPDLVVANFMPDTAASHSIAMMFAGRNLAMGIAMLLVLVWGAPEYFLLIFTIRFMTELADVIATIANAASFSAVLPMIVFLCVFLVLEAYVVVTMRKIVQNRS